MKQKWFYGVSTTKAKFLGYVESTYTYERLISIHPVELKEIAEEAIFFARTLRVKLPDYFSGMAENPVAFSQQALDQGITPDYSEITKINEQDGTDYSNMIEYLEATRKGMGEIPEGEPNDPVAVMASDESESVFDDVDAYVNGVLSKP